MRAIIKGVYSSDKETGKDYVTPKGNAFIKLSVKLENEEIVYDAFFFTKPAHWKVEQFFKAVGLPSPTFDEVSFKHFLDAKEREVEVEHGTDKKGYPKIYKYKKFIVVSEEPTAEPTDEISGQSSSDPTDPELDEELNEDVPF
jgi:hypothetical protein